MCGRYAQFRSIEAVRAFFGTSGPAPNHPPSWNVAPTRTAPVVRRHPETGERRLDLLRWSLLPGWVKDPKGTRQPINARAETVSRQRPAQPGRFQPLQVPADGSFADLANLRDLTLPELSLEVSSQDFFHSAHGHSPFRQT